MAIFKIGNTLSKLAKSKVVDLAVVRRSLCGYKARGSTDTSESQDMHAGPGETKLRGDKDTNIPVAVSQTRFKIPTSRLLARYQLLTLPISSPSSIRTLVLVQ